MPILVARSVENLRACFPKINKQGTHETVLDSGSEVVSIPEKVATSLGISWDPGVKMEMEGVHGDGGLWE
ncbi:hypothetical protein CPB84DRAFT_1693969 [Gymnopilus junonius]|uniref:Uncharacterized protein n=1 Tax=Gymnopilus junonius TaxID=109634 RepID=A0A9P5TFW3_GYMJU|nr:hypothetical protein CPB84DRAFT_1693969 [Gymnopilus junonius]